LGQYENLWANYINICASNLQKSNFLVVFQGRNYVTIDTKNRIISDSLSLPSETMAFFRNFGDELVLLNSDFYKGEAVIPYNMHKFDSSTGKMVGFREQIFSYDGPSSFRQNIFCSTFTDKRRKILSARCANSNQDLGEVIDISLLDQD
jgi:hypothetical protein